MENDIFMNAKPYKVKDVSRANCKGIAAASLDEVKAKSAEKFGKNDMPKIHLDSDGTEIDDEDYFQTLEPNTELVAVFEGEQWIDPTHYVTVTTRRNSADTTDSADVERVQLKSIVSQLKNNLYNVSVLSEPDLEMITNMDPNSVADITGKDFIEQLKEVSGRFLHEKREALDAIELLKLFAKHKGISIEIATDDTLENEQQRTNAATNNFDECKQQQQPPLPQTDDVMQQQKASTSSSPITMNTNILENVTLTTNDDGSVIQVQPSSPTIKQLPNTPIVDAVDNLIIEQTTSIHIKKTTSNI